MTDRIFTPTFFNTDNENIGVEMRDKRYIDKVPDVSMLTPEQKDAYEGLTNFLYTARGGFYLFMGYAGTGKTFVMAKVIETLLAKNKTKTILMTAPTNKAVRVMYNAADYTHSNLDYSTVHSALGLKEDIDKDGKQIFKKQYDLDVSMDFIDVAGIDEVSMLSDELFYLIKDYVEKGVQVIFVGDPAQIPPVGHDECIPFKEEWQKKLNMQTSMLTQIVRQAEGNPIIELSMLIRENLDKNVLPIKRDDIVLPDGSGIVYLDASVEADKQRFEAILEFMFCSDSFQKDANYSKVLCYRNKTVDLMNKNIREMIYGENVGKLEKGEKLISKSPVFKKDEMKETIIFPTNAEFVVEGYEVESESVNNGQFILNFYNTLVSYSDDDGVLQKVRIKIIHEDSESKYNELLSLISELARAAKKGSFESMQYWKQFWSFKKHFADVAYNYAITVHRSQGSTYMNCMLLETDVDILKRVRERNRIKYTAVTRPSKRLIMVRF